MGRILALLTNIRLGWNVLPVNKHIRLLGRFVYYGRKRFYNIGPWGLTQWLEAIIINASLRRVILEKKKKDKI